MGGHEPESEQETEREGGRPCEQAGRWVMDGWSPGDQRVPLLRKPPPLNQVPQRDHFPCHKGPVQKPEQPGLS